MDLYKFQNQERKIIEGIDGRKYYADTKELVLPDLDIPSPGSIKVDQDFAEAAKWSRLAAEQGDASAQFNLGLMYQYGRGVLQDNQTSHMWYNLASANGYEDSGTLRDELAAKMTPAAIEEAQRRARVCMASNYQDCD